ncbi:pilus assembly protein TadE [Pseudoxanthomonas broegbernensis]|uniref:Pilus assembly protein TadE n=1 Tax=Pseudoxanthomonas broegbernensis TaxID=83619 RepID=A0A7V8GL16_9GAMM|nr:TadE/TadG family type IV pilus assembly protein [Pseudoxanthomonas broegbernensis]KAF1685438.1 pilus assembly protein TadE [Pseudoxanthomonas broegbernensis]MBB6064431.1 Flp pilus assembly protein TadG [Pseudoxanthomonas broegbernensis]
MVEPTSPRACRAARRRRPHGVVTVEFALLLMLGLLPLLLLTYSGVMILAAQQSLSLASAEGARAAVIHGSDAERRTAACMAATRSMQWLLDFSGNGTDCAAPDSPSSGSAAVAVSTPAPCAGNVQARCLQVVTRYDYDTHPFIPGVGRVYGWVLGGTIASSAIAQIDTGTE